MVETCRIVDDDRLIELISSHRKYVSVLAGANLRRQLKRKVSTSDVVQITLMKAVSRKETLQAFDPRVVRAWLRTILANTIADLEKHYLSDKRDVRREQDIQADIEQSHAGLAAIIPADQTSPSLAAVHIEDADRLASALQRLPDEMRQVVVLKHLKGLTIQQISDRMGRTGPSVASYLRRGLAQLRVLMHEPHQH